MSIHRLTDNYEKLTNLEKKIVEYILKNPEEFIRSSSAQVAKKLYVSKTSIINLCKKIGFEGFTELKYYIKDYLSKKEEINDVLYYEKILKDLSEEVTKTFAIQDEENIRSIVEKILNSKTVYIVARGASKPLGDVLSTRLSMLNVKSIFIEDYNLIEVIGETITEGETLILISLSGETEKIVNVAKLAGARKVDIIAITAFYNNTLEKLSNYKLFFFAENVSTKVNDLVSRLGMYAVIQLLIEYIKLKGRKMQHE